MEYRQVFHSNIGKYSFEILYPHFNCAPIKYFSNENKIIFYTNGVIFLYNIIEHSNNIPKKNLYCIPIRKFEWNIPLLFQRNVTNIGILNIPRILILQTSKEYS